MKTRALAIMLAVTILTINIIAVLFVEEFTIFAEAKDSTLVPNIKEESNTQPLDVGQITADQDTTLPLTPKPANPSTPKPLEPSQIAAQDKAMDFMKNMLPVDLSKYSINIRSNSIMNGVPTAKDDNRIIINVLYELKTTDSYLQIGFAFEKGVMTSCFLTPIEGKVIANRQYDDPLVAAKDFLERYQEYTKTDSRNLIAMLDNIDKTNFSTVTKENTESSTVTTENTKFTITNHYIENQITYSWAQMINGVESRIGTSLEFYMDGTFRSLGDSRALYTLGDTSINISEEQAIDIALENLKSYSYDMYDGVVVKDFKVSRENIVATLVTASVDYELRPYWDIRMALDEVYPGNVQGITAFIWANTGEVISYSNMAFGGTVDSDNNNPTDSETASPNSTLAIVIATVMVAAIAVAALVLVTKKRHK
jgi:hypothetical protein